MVLYNFKPEVVTAKPSDGGLGFPDFIKANAVASISQIHRQLISPKATIGTIFNITHACWFAAMQVWKKEDTYAPDH